MEDRDSVALVGDSVLMESLGNKLQNELSLNVYQLSLSNACFYERLISIEPVLIILDLDNTQSSLIFSLLRERSKALIIGIDLNSSQILLLKSNRHQVQSFETFCQLIQTELDCSVRRKMGGETYAQMDIQ